MAERSRCIISLATNLVSTAARRVTVKHCLARAVLAALHSRPDERRRAHEYK
jgi:hypothetical protein